MMRRVLCLNRLMNGRLLYLPSDIVRHHSDSSAGRLGLRHQCSDALNQEKCTGDDVSTSDMVAKDGDDVLSSNVTAKDYTYFSHMVEGVSKGSDAHTVTKNLKNAVNVQSESGVQRESVKDLTDTGAPELDESDVNHSARTPNKKHTVLTSNLDDSEVLQKLKNLGADLDILERYKSEEECQRLLGLDYITDIMPVLYMLSNFGVSAERIGPAVSNNLQILYEDKVYMKTVVHYLESSGFSKEQIAAVVSFASDVLTMEIKQVAASLSFLEKVLGLEKSQVRQVISSRPRILLRKLPSIKANVDALKSHFSAEAVSRMVVLQPSLLLATNVQAFSANYAYLRDMGYSREDIATQPAVLRSKFTRIRTRHLFLVEKGRTNFSDPAAPNYMSIIDFSTGSNAEFATVAAGSSSQEFFDYGRGLKVAKKPSMKSSPV